MKKRIVGIMLAAVLAAAMIGCGGGSSSSGSADNSAESTEDAGGEEGTEVSGDVDASSLKVGIVMKSSDEFQNAVVEGATDAAKEAGISEANIKAVAPNNESDAMQQVTAIEDMISSGMNIILNSCQEENALAGVLQQAADAGIKVVMVDTDCASFEDKVTFIGTDNYQAAYDGATEFAKMLDEGSNVVILRGKLGDVNHENRTNGLQDALKEAGMNVLEVQDANCETDRAANAMEAFMSKYDDIDAVMVTSDSMAVGAAQAIKGAGKEGIKVCGFDGFQSAIQLFDTGEISMIIAQKPYQMGYDGVNDAIAALGGETFESYINPGIAVINADNYTEYKK